MMCAVHADVLLTLLSARPRILLLECRVSAAPINTPIYSRERCIAKPMQIALAKDPRELHVGAPYEAVKISTAFDV